MQAVVDGHVFGVRNQWERHEAGDGSPAVFVKPILTNDAAMKARIANRFDEMGFIPEFFRESGHDFVAIAAVKEKTAYASVEEAFVKQILSRL